MTQKIYNERWMAIETVYMSGNRKLNYTIDNAAAVDNGSGTVRIPITGHGMDAGCYIQILGSVNYNGVFKVQSVAANYVVIQATYVAEAFAGTETWKICFKPYQDFELLETRLKLSDVSAAENLLHLLDANAGSAFDATLDTTAMNGLTEKIIVWRDATKRRFFDYGDIIAYNYANTNNRSWGITMIFRMRA